MAFIEVRLDVGVSLDTTGGPEFLTDVVILGSGYEQRNANWSQARSSWELGTRVIDDAERLYLIDFFRSKFGQQCGFRFKDWSDFEVIGQQIGIGDAAQTDYQIIKQYTDPTLSNTESRDIKKPVVGTLVVKLNGVVTAAYTLDSVTGIITFTVAPGIGVVIEVSCEFDVPVRFNTDKMDLRFEAYRESDKVALFFLGALPLVELRI
jgi:uncharacterized protein (TIGR02217 family)